MSRDSEAEANPPRILLEKPTVMGCECGSRTVEYQPRPHDPTARETIYCVECGRWRGYRTLACWFKPPKKIKTERPEASPLAAQEATAD